VDNIGNQHQGLKKNSLKSILRNTTKRGKHSMDHQELYNIKKNKANLVCNILLSEDRTTSSLENQKVAS